MHRQPLLQSIGRYALSYPSEQEVVQRFRQFVEQHGDCFSRALEIGHVTGSAWVVDAKGTNVLLTHHRKLDIWVQLGGHCDGDPDTARVAAREAQEESGLLDLQAVDSEIFDLDIHAIPARAAEPAHHHFDVRYVFRAPRPETIRLSRESKALAWIEVASLAEVTQEESMLRMRRKWLSQLH